MICFFADHVVYILHDQQKRRTVKTPKKAIEYFDRLGPQVYTTTELIEIYHEYSEEWFPRRNVGFQSFIEVLISDAPMNRKVMEAFYRPETRFVWREVSPYVVALSLKKKAYLAYFSALVFNDLTDQTPKTIYINSEQARKSNYTSKLTQDGIDRAFSKPIRPTKNITRYDDYRIHIHNGMNTRRLGVIDTETDKGHTISVTNLERTLIDIAVRPEYAGGVYEVASAYKRAAARTAVNRLVAYLKQLGFIYPYHQAIGFYMEKAGEFSSAQLELLRDQEMHFDFYLAHEMSDVEYVPEWRLFIPKGFQ